MISRLLNGKKKANCNLCSSEKSSLEIIDLNRLKLEDFEVSELVDPKMVLVDIREKPEIQSSPHSFSEKVIELPNSEFNSWSQQIDPHKQYLFFCQKGHRSFDLVEKLRKQKSENCFSLHGGLDSVSS